MFSTVSCVTRAKIAQELLQDVAQLFIEAFVLSVVAALVGVTIAALGLRQVGAAILPLASDLPFWISFRLSPGAVLYALVLSVFAAAIVGIVPALQATRRRLQTGFGVVGTGGMRLGKIWTILIIAQVSFAVAVLPPAVSSAWEDTRDGFAGLGFAAEEFLSAQLGMDSDTRRLAGGQAELMRRLEAERRVSGVTFAMFNPGDEGAARIDAEGAQTAVHEVRFNRVDVNFFRVFEVPILSGRGLQSEDSREGGPVVVNQPFAQQIFGGNALGRRIRYVDSSRSAVAQNAESGRLYEVVGIVGDFPTGASQGMRNPNRAKVYHADAAGQLLPAALIAAVTVSVLML